MCEGHGPRLMMISKLLANGANVSGMATARRIILHSGKGPIISSHHTSAQLNDRVVYDPSDPVWLMTGLEPVSFT